MKYITSILISLFLISNNISAGDLETTIDAASSLTTDKAQKGIPNGSSNSSNYLDWLEQTEDEQYGIDSSKPIEIGGFLKGTGNSWSAQYFSSLLGPDGEQTEYERIGTCCSFKVTDQEIIDQGFEHGLIDMYKVKISGNIKAIKVYVTHYSEGDIYAPYGFSVRGKKSPNKSSNATP
jgi:hypothetical protein